MKSLLFPYPRRNKKLNSCERLNQATTHRGDDIIPTKSSIGIYKEGHKVGVKMGSIDQCQSFHPRLFQLDYYTRAYS